MYTCIMDRFFLLIVFDVNDIGENGQEFFKKLWVWVYGCTMDWGAVIVTLVVFYGIEFFQLIDDCEVAGKEAVVLLRKV